MAHRHQQFSPTLILQLESRIVHKCFFCFDIYLHAPRGDVPDQGEGTHLGVLEVEVLHLQHDLPDDVIPAVAVEAQDHKVKGQNLPKVTSHQILFFAD